MLNGAERYFSRNLSELSVRLNEYRRQPEKTADIWRRFHWFPRQMTSENRAQKFHTYEASLPDLGSTSDWLNLISHAARPIKSATQILVVTRHLYGISALVSQESFGGETSGNVPKCRLFSQAISTTSSYLLYISRGPYHFSTIQTINFFFHFFKGQLFVVANLATIFRIASPVPKF